MAQRITIRQTQDPYVIDIQYIAYGEITIEPNGDLLREAVIKSGMIDPGEKFWVKHLCYWIFLPDRLIKGFVDHCIWQDNERGLVVTVCGYEDHLRAKKRYDDAMDAEADAVRMRRRERQRERLIEWMERTPVNRACNYVASGISRAVSHCSELKPQPKKLSQITHLLTCWRQGHVGDHGYLEATDVMKEEKERWEVFLKGRKEARA